MKRYPPFLMALLWVAFSAFLLAPTVKAQEKFQPMVENIIKEVTQNSQLEKLASELLDGIGPRLVGTPEMLQANDWAVNRFEGWGIAGSKEPFGEWKAWQRGISQVEMTSPRIKSLEATQLAWSPATKKPVEGPVVILPQVKTPEEFKQWLPSVKGKIVLVSQYQQSGRPEYQIKEFATPDLYAKMMDQRSQDTKEFSIQMAIIGKATPNLHLALEEAGAIAIGMSYWTGIMGANRIFGARTKKIPTIDIALEDYGMLYRMAKNQQNPKIKINVQSKDLGIAKTYNTIGRIEGKEKPNEYVILSAHLDSWDGAQGATDNGTGTITMMETLRVLKKLYPNNKRTILVCLWGSEEQGLNGSRAFVQDHPEIIKNTQAVFNQDNGTGRVANISGQGFLNSYDFMGRWLAAVPQNILSGIETSYPGMPGGGGSDHASFVAAGIPGFMLSSLSWGYGNYTWHTNRDTYDKIVFDEVRKNVILSAVLAYMASEEPELVSREKRVLPTNDGKPTNWPAVKDPQRRGGLD